MPPKKEPKILWEDEPQSKNLGDLLTPDGKGGYKWRKNFEKDNVKQQPPNPKKKWGE